VPVNKNRFAGEDFLDFLQEVIDVVEEERIIGNMATRTGRFPMPWKIGGDDRETCVCIKLAKSAITAAMFAQVG
jgi:hypothetical protein